jgi:hypothetical protein
MTNTDHLSLPEAISAVEAAHTGWHIWQTRSGRMWATTQASDYSVGSGTTLDASTGLQGIERAIGEWEWQHARLLGVA